MQKKIHNILLGIFVLPAVLVMPARSEINFPLNVAEDEELIVSGKTFSEISDLAENEWANVENGGTLTFNNVTLSGNTGKWGIVDNWGSLGFENVTAYENQATTGGVIYNELNTVIRNSNFNSNIALVGTGGAVYNSAGAELKIYNSNFVNNHAEISGGAIYSPGIIKVYDSTFDGNSTGYSAAIRTVSDSASTLTVERSTFRNNHATENGAIGIIDGTGISQIKDSVFEGNYTTFNTADAYTNDLEGGGALSLGSISMSILSNNNFIGNKSTLEGGAITTRTTAQNNTDAKLDIIGGVFKDNAAGVLYDGNTGTTSASVYAAEHGHGGAFYNNFWHNNTNEEAYVNVSGVTFGTAGHGNSAVNGGAVYNDAVTGKVGSIKFTDTIFTDNVATTNGGAIYNVGNLIFAGTNTFSGNTANGVANDIHNIGALTFDTGSKTTMDGGVTGTGTLNVADGATLNLGTASIAQSTITLDGALNAVLRSEDEFAFFDVSDSFGGTTGTLNFDLRAAGTYNVFQGAVFDNEHVVVSSSVFDYEWNDTFDTITVTMKSVEDIAADNGLTNEAAQTVANLVNSSSEKLNDLAGAVQDSLESGDVASVEQAHAAIHPETESVVQTVAMSVQNTVANLASNRLMALNIGRNGGDVNVTGGGVWAQGIYNKTKQNDAFRGYTRGVAGGVDMTLNRALTLGAGYSYAHSDISGTARNTEIDSSTIFAYGQYKPTNWFMHAVANYTMSDYSERAVALGTVIDASYDVHSYGGQLMTGYDFAGGITPSVGVRYMHISADEYKNSLGIKNKLADSDYMTAILETKWTYGFKMNKHLMLRPELHYAVKYDVMSDEQTATVLLPGVDSYVMSGNRLSRIAGEFGGGLGVKINGLDLSVNYEIELREGFTSQTGRARIRYEF